jgi:two-component system sensor histidine kinase YesM
MNYSISRNYNFLIKTFGGSGQIDKEIQYVGDSDIDKVIEQFNLTMKSISDLNKKITEEEIKNFKHSMDKSIYLLKYFNNQINAHFLFNVFSNIRALINLGYHKKACACINYLSRFLRYTLSSANMVKLGEEIKELDIYLSLFKLIYKDIHYDLRINDNCLDDAIPKFIIQPVVENCIMHGLTEKKGSIRIDAKKYNDTISIYVCDDGAGIPKEKLEKINSELMQNADFEIGKNLGLKNVQKRLKLLVSENCFIKLYSEEGKGTITRIKIDWRGKDA